MSDILLLSLRKLNERKVNLADATVLPLFFSPFFFFSSSPFLEKQKQKHKQIHSPTQLSSTRLLVTLTPQIVSFNENKVDLVRVD